MPREPLEEMIGYALEHAEEPDKAEDILNSFCDAVERGRVPDQRVLDYLAKRFKEWLAEQDEDGKKRKRAAFKLVPPLPKGQRRKRTLEKNAERDLELTRAVIRYMDGGVTRDEAFERVAEDHKASVAVVKKAYEAFSRHVYDDRNLLLRRAIVCHMEAGMACAEAIKYIATYYAVSEAIVAAAYSAFTQRG